MRVLKTIKIVGWGFGAVVGLAVLLYLVALLINLRDQPPSADYLSMQQRLAERPAVSHDENAYVHLLGLTAPINADPVDFGARRAAWMHAVNVGEASPKKDPFDGVRLDFFSGHGVEFKRLQDTCRADSGSACFKEFALASRAAWSETDLLLLKRYDALIDSAHYREEIPTDVRTPLPSYQQIIAGQRLWFLRLTASTPEPAMLRAQLARDLRSWRQMLLSSDLLISKMIAVVGVRQHFYYANLVLRGLPQDEAARAVPDEWRVAITDEEKSLRRVMAGELAFTDGMIRETVRDDGFQGYEFEQASIGDRLVRSLGRPLFQRQDMLNRLARQYSQAAEQFEIPIERYLAAGALPPTEAHFPSRVYNLAGDYLLDIGASFVGYRRYGLRAASPEGMRRAALLATELRARGVPVAAMMAAVSAAESRDPFTNRPFGWDATERAVVYEGADGYEPKRLLFLY
jgi:hypothetical protein